MHRLLMILCLALPALAQSPFDGTWVVNTDSAKIHQTSKYMLRNGVYECDSCSPKISVKADGEEHEVSGSPDYDKMAVREVDDHTVEIAGKKGKDVDTDKMVVSGGKTLRDDWTDVSEAGVHSKGTDVYTRVGEAPAGANQISGSWKYLKAENYSEAAMTLTYEMTADTLKMKAGTGQSFTAKMDGNFYPMENSASGTQVSIKKIGANTFEQTSKVGEKVVTIYRVTVDPDGKTMKIHGDNKEQNATYDWVANKK